MRALLRPAAPASAAKQIAEAEGVAEPAEDVFEAHECGRVESRRSLSAEPRVSEAVVGGPLLRIREDGVRFGRLLELLFGVLAALVAVGMVLERKLAVGRLEVAFRRAAFDAKNDVVVGLTHAWATFTMAGRSSRSLSV